MGFYRDLAFKVDDLWPEPGPFIVDGDRVAVEIELHMGGTVTLVGDVFTLLADGRIARVAIYNGPQVGDPGSRACARRRPAARAAGGISGRGVVERQVELVGQRRQPREQVADLMELLVGAALADGLRELAELLGEPRDRRVDARARSRAPYVCAINAWNSSSCMRCSLTQTSVRADR